jgi:hypothetical protein
LKEPAIGKFLIKNEIILAMKNGLLIYNSARRLINIGDYIQSLAALQFLGKADYLINREQLNQFDKEDVKLIMNGWFTSEPENWPPSDKIHPLFVAFHINSLAKNKILSEEGVDYLKKHEPIGCRDEDTTKILRSKGINAYFSGCLTLTLGERYLSEIRNDSIYIVDAFSSSNKSFSTVLTMIGILFRKFTTIRKIAIKKHGKISLQAIIKTISFYREYSKHFTDDLLLRAEYIKHLIAEEKFGSEEEKFEYARKLVNNYANARLVITSRIHCALPCLALETPVIFVDNAQQEESSYCRLNGLRELFNLVTSDKGELSFHFEKEAGKIHSKSIIKNKPNYQILKTKLISSCKTFMQNSPK